MWWMHKHDMWWMYKHDMWWMLQYDNWLKHHFVMDANARHVMDAYARHVMDAWARQAVEIASTTICYEWCNTTNFTRNAFRRSGRKGIRSTSAFCSNFKKEWRVWHKLILSLLTWVYNSAWAMSMQWHDEIFWRSMLNELLGISQNNNFSNETYLALNAA